MAENGRIDGRRREESLRFEALSIISEVSYAVEDIALSPTLPANDDLVYFNITTQEKDVLCVELSWQGFQIVGREYDTVDTRVRGDNQHFETIYALLGNISPQYRQSFGNALLLKLENLQNSLSADNRDEG